MNSRYLKYVILNKQNLMKSNMLDINMKNKNEPNSQQNTDINTNNDENNDKQIYFIIEPNEYIKHFNDIITVV